MLQSDKQPDLIQEELEAFLQEQSRPFVAWLRKQLEAVAAKAKEPGGSGVCGTAGADAAAGGEAVLLKNAGNETAGST